MAAHCRYVSIERLAWPTVRGSSPVAWTVISYLENRAKLVFPTHVGVGETDAVHRSIGEKGSFFPANSQEWPPGVKTGAPSSRVLFFPQRERQCPASFITRNARLVSLLLWRGEARRLESLLV